MTGFRIGRIFGIDVHVHTSWIFIAALVLWSLTSSALPADFPDVAGGARLGMGLLITALFFLSLLAHELAHSVVAMARGIPVQRITFFLFGGMAQTSTDSRSAGEEFLIAIAGPLMSFLLSALCFFLWYTGARAGWPTIAVGSAAYIAVLNLVLGGFNLLPGFPMDGGRVLRAAIWKVSGSVTRATLWAARIGEGMAWLLMAWGGWEVLGGDTVGGIWIVFIGWFIRHAARSSYRQHLMGRMQELAQQAFTSRPRSRARPTPPPPFGPGAPGTFGGGGGPGQDPAGPGSGGRDVTDLGGR